MSVLSDSLITSVSDYVLFIKAIVLLARAGVFEMSH